MHVDAYVMSHMSMRFEVLVTVGVKIAVFLDVTRFTLLIRCQYFYEPSAPMSKIKKIFTVLKMEAGIFSEILTPIYQATQFHSPEEPSLQSSHP